MHRCFALLLLAVAAGSLLAAAPSPGSSLHLVTRASYLPANPLLVRIEVRAPDGQPDRNLWDAEAALVVDAPGIALSTNRVLLRNGVGSALVRFTGGGDFTLTATVGSLSTGRFVEDLSTAPITSVSGTLGGSATTWHGVVRVTGTVTVPAGHTLTIASNTLVLIDGVASGTAGPGLVVNGAVQALGTDQHPVTFTCSDPALRWGQIRHTDAQPSLYRSTIITLAGRAPGEGHTGQGPVLRLVNSTVTLDACSVTDHATAAGTPGKIMQAAGAEVTLTGCLLARARMGPEIQGTALHCTNTWITDMRGPDDADGIYLHDQQAGQQIVLSGCVIADGDDDAIDTLNADVRVEDCIVRDWANPNEDAKGVSTFHGEVTLARTLLAHCYVGIAAKSSGPLARVNIDRCTVTGLTNGVLAAKKSNATAGNIDFRITNSIIRAPNAVHTDFGPTNFTIRFCNLSEAWPGTGNSTADPLLVDEAAFDFQLQAASPCIDTGDPVAALDPDGTRADLGAVPFSGTANPLIPFGSVWKYLDDGSDQGTAWAQPGFDDSGWAAGPAELGYGDDDEATVVDYGGVVNQKHITTWFRRSLVVGNPAQYSGLQLRVIRDDGAVVYLNGHELFRSNMPGGPVDYLTTATTGLGTTEEGLVQTATVGTEWLLPGTNLIAAEIHQSSRTSSDLSFDLELTGVLGNQSPAVTLTSPADGATFTAPAEVTLAATASDSDGSVTRVQFFQDANLLGEDTTAPYAWTWSGVTAGQYALTAVATDDQGASSSSAPVGITVGSSGPLTNTLVTWGSDWRYLDDGSDQGSAWQQTGFDDTAWASGPAQLGYGDGDEATVVSYGGVASAKPIATYFRHAFSVADPGVYTSLPLSVLFDDGAMVYLNGTEVFRCNMPAGLIAYNTPAIVSGVPDNTVWHTNLPPDLLQPGVNVLAVTVHQDEPSSSDISFDLRLQGFIPGTSTNIWPSVVLTSPADGANFTAPAEISLAATASDADGSIARVEFYRDGVKLGEDSSSPYEYLWTGVPVGIYGLSAVAVDNQGASGVSALATVAVGEPNTTTTNIILAAGSDWSYLDDGSDQGTAWRQPAFDDSAWAVGPAQLGYGDGDEATTVSFGPNASAKYPTTYFRRSFTVADPDLIEALNLRLLRDDGGVVYLNGQEVFRVSMPDTFDYLTYATSASDYDWDATALDPTLLLPGSNLFAVEMHQGNGSSSDLSFDLELIGIFAAPTNFKPVVTLTSPADGLTVAAPADLTLAADATDRDGTVTNVLFLANGIIVAQDPTAPYTFAWSNVPAGEYDLAAAAADEFGLMSTSQVVHVSVSTDTAPPTVAARFPAPGAVTQLDQITVTFSKPVIGVDAADLRVNGVPAGSLTGSGAEYTFGFEPPAYGAVNITWATDHGITDVFTPPHGFDASGPGATWSYTLLDAAAPFIAMLDPVPGSSVAALTRVTVTFSEPVTGVSAGDLQIDSVPAANVTGSGAGPYVFGFPQPDPGLIPVAWAAGHGIQDSAGNPFSGVPWSYLLDPNATGIVISEIMYHPASENILEEYLELHNQGAAAVNLAGWQLTDGVQFTFPDVTIPGGGYLVVAADLATFNSLYPGVNNVVGGWTGFLNNRGEDIDLDNADGQRVDSVRYADEGDWAVRQRGPSDGGYRGWIWFKEHDGLGKSLELINPRLSNNHGQNWAASLLPNGTPGTANSVLSTESAPLILEARHSPVIPRSTAPVLVSTRIVDETAGTFNVTLHYRRSTSSPPPFTAASMNDDGLDGDAAAGDGIYSGLIPAQANHTVVEWYLEAADLQGHTRTWPAPAIAAADGAGPTGQVANALFQIDDATPASTQPLYKLIMTETERAELAAIPAVSSWYGPDSQMNGTFISRDGAGTALHYLVGIRNRGHGSRRANPMNYRVNFRSDDRWKDVTGINLNSRYVHAQHFGATLARKAGATGGQSTAVQVRVNNANLAQSGSPMFGSYAANEVVNSDWAERHYPLDADGNVYRIVRDIDPPDFAYRTIEAFPRLYGGDDYRSYTNNWFKESNASENDYSDLIGMVAVMGINNPTPFTPDNIEQAVDAEQWLRHLAVMNLMGNGESGLNTGNNDDYYTYRGINDPRFVLIYHDLDQILGQGGSLASNSDLFRATCCPISGDSEGTWRSMDRFMHDPYYEPLYFRILQDLLDTTFSKPEFDALIDQTLGGYVESGAINSMKSWMDARRNYVRSILPPITASNAPVALVSGAPRSPTPRTSATLTVAGEWITHYRYRLNSANYGPETALATPITLTSLGNGTNTVAVIGRNAAGLWQLESQATVRSWLVNTAWPAVRLNEVLARNVTAVNRAGAFPDLIELFNEGAASVSLAGLRLTDNPGSPDKFTFPTGTSLAAGAYLVLDGNDLGFALSGSGEGVYLYDRLANGGALLDSVEFGLQLADLSVGRVHGGDWQLTQPSFGSANIPVPTGDPRQLRINEWLAAGLNPFPDDFIELYNPETLPVALGGLHLSDAPLGTPQRHRIAPLSFVGAGGFVTFIADGDPDAGADHVDFRLALEQGEIGLFTEDLQEIDCVTYGPQWPGVSRGRCPDAALTQTALAIPTPGAHNACPFTPPPPNLVSLVAYADTWRYEDSGADQGTAWLDPVFDDSGWAEGAGLFAREDCDCLPEPINTPLTFTDPQQITFYYRTHFNFPADLNASGLQVTHLVDDGMILYLNGVEVLRYNMPGGTVNFDMLSSSSVGNATYQGPVSLPLEHLLPGDNVLAVEIHQQSTTSSDTVMGIRLDAVIVTNSPVLAGVQINEFLANNASFEEADGTLPDWVEIFNPSASAVDLVGMSLTDDPADPQRWVFPQGSLVPALGFIKVRMDGSAPASATNTGFGLKASGGLLYLFYPPADGGGLASGVSYGLQAADFSLGRVPDGSANWVLCVPSADSANLPATLGNPQNLVINEWMADPLPGDDDWFEVFNPNPQPVDLSGLHLSDDLLVPTQHQIPPLSFIGAGPRGYQRFWADGNVAAGPDHVNFKLSGAGEALALSDAAGTLLNGLAFGAQVEGVSQGRLPDGAATLVSFPTTPTPGNGNFLPLPGVVINELLSHSDPPLEDAVELHNLTGDDLDVSGWYLSDSQNNLLKYVLPPGSVIPAFGFLVLYEYQFNSENLDEPFSFSSAKGDEVYLSQAAGPGVLTGYRAFAEFGPAENGVSFGRHLTTVGADFTALSARTFGVDNPASTAAFESGTGRTNAYPKVGPVVINEIMYHPANTNGPLEYVELHNLLGTPVPLYDAAHPENTWRLRRGIDFNFPPNTVIPAGGFLVVVSFDPATDLLSRAAFEAEYGTGMVLAGPYRGSLDNAGEEIELRKPDLPQVLPGPDFGLVPYIAVDRIVYDDSLPWPVSPDGGGTVLARATAALYGNDPANWIAATPTPGTPNFSPSENTAPVLGAIGNRTVNEGVALTFIATATDAEAPPQTLLFSLDPGAPAGAAIDPNTGAFAWIPTEAQGPGSYTLTLRVSDSGSPVLSDAETITITVNELNLPPTLTPIGDKVVNEGVVITFTASASDPDLPAQSLTFSLGPGAPAGAAIHPATGAFTWTTDETHGPGSYPLTVRVTDAGTPSLSDTEIINLVVNELNQPPILNPVGNRTVDEGALLTFTATASDADLPAQTLTFSLAPGAPSGAAITPAGLFTWTPTEDQGPGTYTVTVQVTDNGPPAATDTETISIDVREVNEPPAVTPIADRQVDEGDLLRFTVQASDPDRPAQTLTYSLDPGAPTGAAINSGTGEFTWTPGETFGGTTNSVTVLVADSADPAANATATFKIAVAEINEAPMLAAIGDRSVDEGSTLAFTATATDADVPAQTLTFSLAAGAPAGAVITAGGQFTWTPTELQGPGDYPVTVRVTDDGSPAAAAAETITVTVNEVNVAPVLAPIADQTVAEGATLSFTATATDADTPAQALTFTLDPGVPATASITAQGQFTWTPPAGHTPATNLFTVRVTDDGTPLLDDTQSFTVVVVGASRITAITPQAGGGVRIEWSAIAGQTYQVLHTSDLGANNWSNLGSAVTATGATASVVDSSPATAQRFYRIQLVQ